MSPPAAEDRSGSGPRRKVSALKIPCRDLDNSISQKFDPLGVVYQDAEAHPGVVDEVFQ